MNLDAIRARLPIPFKHAAPVAAAALAAFATPPAFAAETKPLPLLHQVFQKDFLIGVSLERSELPQEGQSAPHTDLMVHFNALTPENDMKWERIQPAEGEFRFEAADALLNYAEAHGMKFFAHTLVWHRQTPAWVFLDPDGQPASRELVLARLRTHIHTVMTRYRGRIAGWDVVNEALSDAPNEFLRDSPWRKTIGDDYIAHAFQYAREADPEATLFYNDYAIEYPHKRQHLMQLMKALQNAGAAPDAVNLQGHYTIDSPPISQIEATLDAIATLGFRANISELDVSLFHYLQRDNPYPQSAPTEVLQKQAERYAELFTLFRKHAANLDRVTFWNLHDGLSWLNNEPVPGRTDYPLLFDRNAQPKPAFFHVIQTAQP